MAAVPPPADLRAAHRARCTHLVRQSLSVLSSKWAVGVLLALGDGSLRYHELLAELDPISEKVLTQTLRGMERDGLVVRSVHSEVPLRVEYELSPLGASLGGPLKALGNWALGHGALVQAARDRYDAREAPRGSAAA